MEQLTYSINHHPCEYFIIINPICITYNIDYKLFVLENGKYYKADILYNNIRYSGEKHKTLELTIEDLVMQIRYLLAHNINLDVHNILETLEYVIDKIKEYRYATTKRSKIQSSSSNL